MRSAKKSLKKDKSPDFRKLLRHKDVEIRRSAVCRLREVRNKSSVIPLLLKCLEDTDWRIRKTAIYVLLRIKGRNVVKALIKTLASENANARNSAADALVELGSEAEESLIEVFTSSDVDVKKLILDIIGPTERVRVIDLLLLAIKDDDNNIKATAIEYLGDIKSPQAVDALLPILKSDNQWIGFHAVDALGKIGGKRATKALISLLRSKVMKRPVLKALVRISDPHSLSSIIPLLNDETESIRAEALTSIEKFYINNVSEEVIINALIKAFGNRTVHTLKQYNKSRKKEVRIASTVLLGLFRDKESVASIVDMSIEKEHGDTLKRVLTFIGYTSPQSLMPFFKLEDPYKVRILCEVAGMTGNKAFLKALIKKLKYPDSHVRSNAAKALSRLNDLGAVKHIKPLLLDQYEDIQETAIRALAALKEGLDLNEFTGLLSDRNPVLRKNSAKLLGMIGDKTSIKALGMAMKDSDVKVRVAVIEALVAIDGKKVFKFILQAITDEMPDIRKIAALVLGKFTSKTSFETLVLLLHDPDTWVRAFAIKGLGRMKDRRAISYLINLLPDDSGVVRTSAIEALANFREEKVRKSLLKLLSDEDAEIRSTAIESLSVFEGVSGKIIPLLNDRDWAVRKKAVEVLGRFYSKESYSYLEDMASLDDDIEVRKAAARYISV